jgi:hypothetical protein
VVRNGEVVGISSLRYRKPALQEGAATAFTLFPFETVNSAVYVMRNAALANRDLAAARSDRARACLSKLLGHTLGLLGDNGKEDRPPFYEDTLGFIVGPAEIVLHTFGSPRPFPAATERHLLSLLYSRAKAHQL